MSFGVTDEDLVRALEHRTKSKSSPARIRSMIEACRRIDQEGIAGDIVECGVWRGGNIIIARLIAPGRMCWLYDTFTGMTEPTPVDVSRSGKSAIDSWRRKEALGVRWAEASVEEVRGHLAEFGALDDAHLRFVVGDVGEMLQSEVPNEIALLRLDTDFYASTRVELQVLYPRLSPGGILIVDDYGHWLGARRAVDEYFKGAVPLRKIDYTAVEIVKCS